MQISHDVNNFVTLTGDKVQGRERANSHKKIVVLKWIIKQNGTAKCDNYFVI